MKPRRPGKPFLQVEFPLKKPTLELHQERIHNFENQPLPSQVCLFPLQPKVKFPQNNSKTVLHSLAIDHVIILIEDVKADIL